MAASEGLLALLHDAAAKLLLARIQSGEATASDVANALKMLKDNNITCQANDDNELGQLEKALQGKDVGPASELDLSNALESLEFNVAREA